MAKQSKHLKKYHELGILKADFKETITKTTGWSNATFYNKLQGSQKLTPLEKTEIENTLQFFAEKLTQIKAIS